MKSGKYIYFLLLTVYTRFNSSSNMIYTYGVTYYILIYFKYGIIDAANDDYTLWSPEIYGCLVTFIDEIISKPPLHFFTS